MRILYRITTKKTVALYVVGPPLLILGVFMLISALASDPFFTLWVTSSLAVAYVGLASVLHVWNTRRKDNVTT